MSLDEKRLYESVMAKYNETLERGNKLKERENEINARMLYLCNEIKELELNKPQYEIEHDHLKEMAEKLGEKLKQIENFQASQLSNEVARQMEGLKDLQDKIRRNNEHLRKIDVDHLNAQFLGNIESIKRYIEIIKKRNIKDTKGSLL
ncbi:hypothetical protein TVAG_239420 [Trichomonas vaginalis G3]|uniref:Uncharacterized protein n=1 Tax=Trichomonas vaginalis (strain ATCC PRA-98 / G3) TaxID=412133 RepID=A2DGH1_TRIV3|nr:hypothetical protein TVAGG3_0965910 [Trichomonas vaginalis G3]EAY20567.1 hypothetical protein TVAG_239420 [Trichomonas vaginalis G3]KAI5488238.1 hypothetical protein TVAGG3_0965910 [Trichomonas vaginalis G3]|eukprot:XP_001581553.1 hypothetical protein [Trichomonas vaginalis G3]